MIAMEYLRGPDPRRPDRRRPDRPRLGGPNPLAGLRRDGRGAPSGTRPRRPQAGEHHGLRMWDGQGPRLRPLPSRAPAPIDLDPDATVDEDDLAPARPLGDAELHGPRAGPGRAAHECERRLRPRRDRLRDAHRPQGVPRRQPPPGAQPDRAGRPGRGSPTACLARSTTSSARPLSPTPRTAASAWRGSPGSWPTRPAPLSRSSADGRHRRPEPGPKDHPPCPTPRPLAIFDHDGVLVDSLEHHQHAWLELGRKTGLPITDDFIRETFGMTNPSIFARLLGRELDAETLAKYSDMKEECYREVARGQHRPPARDQGPARRPDRAGRQARDRVERRPAEPPPDGRVVGPGGPVRRDRLARRHHARQARPRGLPGRREEGRRRAEACGRLRGRDLRHPGREGGGDVRRRRHDDQPGRGPA